MAPNARNNVLVVGGSSGIGFATAKLCLTHLPGTRLIISSSNKEKLEKAVEGLKSAAPTDKNLIDYVVADISNISTQFDDVERLLKEANSRFGGPIDHIVWTAGSFPHGSKPEKPSNDDLLAVSVTRLFGPLTLTELGKKYMANRQTSSITLSSGLLIHKPRPGTGRLAGIGGGLESAARGLAVELAPIRANTVVLGAIKTPLLDRFADNQAVMKQLADSTVLKSVGEADEAAEAYLASIRCSYMTGSRIDCEGGGLLC